MGSKVDEFPVCLRPSSASCLPRTADCCSDLGLSTLVPHTEVLIKKVSSLIESRRVFRDVYTS